MILMLRYFIYTMMRNKKGQFIKGNTAGGRKKGSKNKITQKVRETFLHFINANLDRMQKDFDGLEPRERFKVLFDMAKYVMPTLKSVEFGNVLDELSEEDFNILIEKLKKEHLN